MDKLETYFIIVGLNHKTAPIDIREKLSFSESEYSNILNYLKKSHYYQELMILSTCNRTEVSFVTNNPEPAIDNLLKFFEKTKNINKSILKQYLYILFETDAVAHFLKIPASLDSMVIGEPQIASQFKSAYKEAIKEKTIKSTLNYLCKSALKISSKIRTSTDIGKFSVSVSSMAVKFIKTIFDDLKNINVLVIGAGEMGKSTLKYLAEEEVNKIIICNRNFDKAKKLAHIFNGEPLPLNELNNVLNSIDAIITSTASKKYIITESDIRKIRKPDKFIVIIDLAIPRDVDPNVQNIPNIFLYNIDDLKDFVDRNINIREQEKLKALSFIEYEINNYLKWKKIQPVNEIIAKLMKKILYIQTKEINKALNKISKLQVDKKNLNKIEKILNDLTKSVIQKSFSPLFINLKKGVPYCDDKIIIDSLKYLFEIND